MSVNQDYNNPTKRVGLVQNGPHHHFIENLLDIAEVLMSWR